MGLRLPMKKVYPKKIKDNCNWGNSMKTLKCDLKAKISNP